MKKQNTTYSFFFKYILLSSSVSKTQEYVLFVDTYTSSKSMKICVIYNKIAVIHGKRRGEIEDDMT